MYFLEGCFLLSLWHLMPIWERYSPYEDCSYCGCGYTLANKHSVSSQQCVQTKQFLERRCLLKLSAKLYQLCYDYPRVLFEFHSWCHQKFWKQTTLRLLLLCWTVPVSRVFRTVPLSRTLSLYPDCIWQQNYICVELSHAHPNYSINMCRHACGKDTLLSIQW